ncbi:MAG: VCBS repeat-containing protein [Planctomycetes bacterium]|nr:VCBS repeat-containing protein [Planctomycetota bacterium]
MIPTWTRALALVSAGGLTAAAVAAFPLIEESDDGRTVVVVRPSPTAGMVTIRDAAVPYGTAPDWENTLRMQVGGLQVADMNGDGWPDIVVGCYISNSYPPYETWNNLLYYNNGGTLELEPSWVSTDQVSTGDVQVGDINGDGYPDIFSANGGFAMSPSVIYFGGPGGPSTSPGWSSAEPGAAWNNYAILFDFDHDGDLDVVTANQGNSEYDPYRPMYAFVNNNGALPTIPTWQSAETSIQNFLAFGDFDGDGWEDLAVSKWANFETGIYKNINGVLQTTPVWTSGSTTTDKGVAWADVDGNGWLDLAVGRNPTALYTNSAGSLAVTWTSGATFFGHSELRFCDVNRDGWPDLAEVHFSDGRVHIYLNRSGVLDTTPSWTYDSPTVGTALAFGDINGDGWPDLVVGNSGKPCVKVFLARPPLPGDLNGDGAVDLTDLTLLLNCMSGPDVDTPPGGCDPAVFARADLDDDDDVDVLDFVLFQFAYQQ